MEKHFSFSCEKCPFPPFQTADHVLRRQGKATDMILSQEASRPVCFLISGLSTAQNCHPGDVTGVGVLLPEVWAQAGLLVSCLPQLTRHTGALRAVKQLNLDAFPIPLWPCPTLHMSLLDVLPPSSSADPLNLFSRFLPTYFISDQCQKQLAGSLNILFFGHF